MRSQCVENIASHWQLMGRRFERSPLLVKNALPALHLSFVRRSKLSVRYSMFKEWWTPIRHAHEKPMRGEHRISWSPHGQAIRRSPLLGKNALPAFHLSFVRRSKLSVRYSMFKEWWTPIRHAHEKPMGGENRFSWSPHGQAIRRSPLLGKMLGPHSLLRKTSSKSKLSPIAVE